ncbi:MAG: hypothetical protein VXA39_10995 [Deltaproteobacteria bacterium]
MPKNYYRMDIGERFKKVTQTTGSDKGARAKIVAQNSLRPYDIY